jgi:hypothetical protein
MTVLPQELIDTILEELGGPTAHASLKSCSLVARPFLVASQRRLFRFLALTSKTVDGASSRFTERPHLASYVRDLHIDLHLDTKYYRIPLLKTLRLLNKVQRMAISSYSWQTWVWDSFPDELRATFVSLLTLPSLRCLALTRCRGVPLALIRHALASYKEVGLLVAAIDVHQHIELLPTPSGNDGKSLTHLLLNYTPSQNPLFHSLVLGDEISPSLIRLRHLELAVPIGGCLSGLDNIALKYSNSLRHLVINFWRAFQIFVPKRNS